MSIELSFNYFKWHKTSILKSLLVGYNGIVTLIMMTATLIPLQQKMARQIYFLPVPCVSHVFGDQNMTRGQNMMKVKCYILSASVLFVLLTGCNRQENRVLDCKKDFSQECEWELSSVEVRTNPIVRASLAGDGCRQGNDKACEVLSSIFADNRRLRSNSYVLTSVPLDENGFALQVGEFFSTLPGLRCSEFSPGWRACQDFLHTFGETFSYFIQAGEDQAVSQDLNVQDKLADKRVWTRISATDAENNGQGWYGTSRMINCSMQEGQPWHCQTIDPATSHSKSDTSFAKVFLPAGTHQDGGANADNPYLLDGVFTLSQALCEQKADCVALMESLLTQELGQSAIETYHPKMTYFSDQSLLLQPKDKIANLSSKTSTSLPVVIEQTQDRDAAFAEFLPVTNSKNIVAGADIADPLLPIDTLVAGFCHNQVFCQDALNTLLMGEEVEFFNSGQQKGLVTTAPKIIMSNQLAPTNSQVKLQQAENHGELLGYQEQAKQQEKLAAFQIGQHLGQQGAEFSQKKGEQLQAIIEQSRQKNAMVTAGEKNRLLKEGLYSGAQSAQLSLKKKDAYQGAVQTGEMDEAQHLSQIKLDKFQRGIVEGTTAAKIIQNKLSYFQRGLVSGEAAGRLEKEKRMAFIVGEKNGFAKEQAILTEQNKKISPSSAPSHSNFVANTAVTYPVNSQTSQEITAPLSQKDRPNQNTVSTFIPLLQVLDDVPSASKTQCINGNLRACYQLAELYARGGEGVKKNTILADNIVEQLCKVSASGNQEGQFYCAKAQLNKLAAPATIKPQGNSPQQMIKDSCQNGFKEACQFLKEQTAN